MALFSITWLPSFQYFSSKSNHEMNTFTCLNNRDENMYLIFYQLLLTLILLYLFKDKNICISKIHKPPQINLKNCRREDISFQVSLIWLAQPICYGHSTS